MTSPEESAAGIDDLSPRDQERLIAILDAYMIAAEEGAPSDPERLIKEHPELAGPLRQYLHGLDLIQVATDQARQSSASSVSRNRGPSEIGQAPSAPAAELQDYQIEQELGRGSMGIVYAATDLRTGQHVALKILAFGASLSPDRAERFAREARAARSLKHPNIVPVYEIGCDNGVHFYTMQRIEGQSLDKQIAAARSHLEGRRSIVPILRRCSVRINIARSPIELPTSPTLCTRHMVAASSIAM
ncbi:MAG: protein kinase [Pirellulaceae bacterium]